jgi:hypothetical protein
MEVAKISVTFPTPVGGKMKDYLLSMGFNRNKFNPREWDADLTDAALNFAIKMNERYATQKKAVITFFQKAPEDVLKYIKKQGFVFSWTDKQWHGLESSLTPPIIEDILRIGSINYIE